MHSPRAETPDPYPVGRSVSIARQWRPLAVSALRSEGHAARGIASCQGGVWGGGPVISRTVEAIQGGHNSEEEGQRGVEKADRGKLGKEGILGKDQKGLVAA